jgi:hypothetical protein
MHGHVYSETIGQPALAAVFDLNQALGSETLCTIAA